MVRGLAEHADAAMLRIGLTATPPGCPLVAWTGWRYAHLGPSLPKHSHPWVRFLQAIRTRQRKRRLGGDTASTSTPIASESADWIPGWMERTIGLAFWRRPTVAVGGDDLLLLADASWNSASLLDHAAAARQRGTRIALLLHDLLPLQVPETCAAGVPGRFRRWLDRALPLADVVMTVSEATRQAVLEHARRQLEIDPPRVRAFRLGADITSADPSAGGLDVSRLRPSLASCFVGDPTVICVGTLEPRKNHERLLEAFEAYWERGGEARLLLIGAVGWNSDELMQRLDRHPRRGRRLLVFHDLDDRELAYAYRAAAAVVCPSLAEGFGLPIIEALRQGARVLASDISPHREAGGDHVTYFPPHDSAALAGLLGRLETLPEPGALRPQVLTWLRCTEIFFEALFDELRSAGSGA